jgi:porin-like protein
MVKTWYRETMRRFAIIVTVAFLGALPASLAAAGDDPLAGLAPKDPRAPADEPKPDTFAKVCDVYGEGYTHVPGTDVCIRVGGYVKMNIISSSRGGQGPRPGYNDPDGITSGSTSNH